MPFCAEKVFNGKVPVIYENIIICWSVEQNNYSRIIFLKKITKKIETKKLQNQQSSLHCCLCNADWLLIVEQQRRSEEHTSIDVIAKHQQRETNKESKDSGFLLFKKPNND